MIIIEVLQTNIEILRKYIKLDIVFVLQTIQFICLGHH